MKSIAFFFSVASLIANISSADEVNVFHYEATELVGPGIVLGMIQFDTSVADTLPNPEVGLFPAAGTWTGDIFGGDQDGFSFIFDALDVTIINLDAPPVDSLTMSFSGNNFVLSDSSGMALESDQLPSILNVDSFDSASFSINGQPFFITSITAVPEPTSALILVSATAIGLSSRRTRH